MSTATPLLIRGGTVVTMDADRRILNADVLVVDGRIEQIGALRKPRGARVLDAKGAWVIPGLIQAHVHLCQTLFRGLADDLALLPWLKTRIWPFEAAHDSLSLKASAELGLAEMLKAGTTCLLDMGTVHHQDAIFRAMARSGMRGFSGKAMMDTGEGVPAGLQESTEDSLEQSHLLAERWNGAEHGRLGYAYAPRFILSCTEKLWRAVALAAKERGLRIHSHIAEHADERKAVKAILGQYDVSALFDYGVSGPHVLLAHGVQLRPAEMRRLAKAGTRIVHCPSANLKLASGIANVPQMRDAGVVVALGSDGAPCNNRMDPWTEMRSAALLAKVKNKDASSLPAEDAFELATIDGARALGLEADIGSIECGKKGDIVVVGQHALHQLPGQRAYSQLVYASTPADVRHVMIDGRVIVENRALMTLDETKVISAARRQSKRLQERVAL